MMLLGLHPLFDENFSQCMQNLRRLSLCKSQLIIPNGKAFNFTELNSANYF